MGIEPSKSSSSNQLCALYSEHTEEAEKKEVQQEEPSTSEPAKYTLIRYLLSEPESLIARIVSFTASGTLFLNTASLTTNIFRFNLPGIAVNVLHVGLIHIMQGYVAQEPAARKMQLIADSLANAAIGLKADLQKLKEEIVKLENITGRQDGVTIRQETAVTLLENLIGDNSNRKNSLTHLDENLRYFLQVLNETNELKEEVERKRAAAEQSLKAREEAISQREKAVDAKEKELHELGITYESIQKEKQELEELKEAVQAANVNFLANFAKKAG